MSEFMESLSQWQVAGFWFCIGAAAIALVFWVYFQSAPPKPPAPPKPKVWKVVATRCGIVVGVDEGGWKAENIAHRSMFFNVTGATLAEAIQAAHSKAAFLAQEADMMKSRKP